MDIDTAERRLGVLVSEMAGAKTRLDYHDRTLQLFLSVLPHPDWGPQSISVYKRSRAMLADDCIMQMDELINMVQACLDISREFGMEHKTVALEKKLQDMRVWQRRYVDLQNDPRPLAE